MAGPRRQHYFFAHQYLREKAERMPLETVDTLSKPSAANYLSFLWVSLGFSSQADEDDFIPAEGIECFPLRISDTCSAVVVQLPPPERMAEAYFVAIVVWHDRTQSQSRNANIRYRYFTLELTENSSGRKQTILGEWVDGSHCNYGEGPVPNKDAFIEAVIALMNEEIAQRRLPEIAPESIPLPADIVEGIAAISRSFLEEGRTDLEGLVDEFEAVLGEEFEYVADFLPAIFAAEEAAFKEKTSDKHISEAESTGKKKLPEQPHEDIPPPPTIEE